MVHKDNTALIFAEALRTLLQEKNFEKITTKEIIKRSGASKATFYRHFQDKYSLMTWAYKKHAEEIFAKNSTAAQCKDILIECFQYIKENQDYFSKIIKFEGQNSFNDFLYLHCKKETEKRIIKAIGKALPPDMEFSVRFYSSALTYVTSGWIKGGLRGSPEQMAQSIFDNIPLSIRTYLQ